jgi:hypothetical protein
MKAIGRIADITVFCDPTTMEIISRGCARCNAPISQLEAIAYGDICEDCLDESCDLGTAESAAKGQRRHIYAGLLERIAATQNAADELKAVAAEYRAIRKAVNALRRAAKAQAKAARRDRA